MKNEIIFDNPRLKVFKSEKGFIFSERKGKDSIAVIPYRIINKKMELLVRLQPLVFNQGTKLKIEGIEYKDIPADELMRCPITGSLDSNYTNIIDYVVDEIKEESGFSVKPDDIISVGYYFVGTQTNEVVHCFTCNVSGKFQGSSEGDGTYWESISKNEWVSLDEILEQINDIHYSGLLIILFKMMQSVLMKKSNII